MQTTKRRTVPVGLAAFLIILSALILLGAPSANANNGFTVDGMDGIVTITDARGAFMTVPADCARVIVNSPGLNGNLENVHRTGITHSPAYLEACF